VGVVLLNFGYAPRSGHGGLAVSICDELAGQGIDAFRVDLPALGDSVGELPASFQDWASGVRAGTMTAVTVAALEAIRRDFALTDIIVGGLCAASITALYAFEKCPELVSALVLLEPELFAATTSSEEASAPSTTSPPTSRMRQELLSKLRGVFSAWGWMRLLAGEHELLNQLPLPRRLLLKALTVMNSALPDHTNRRLVEAWQSAARSQVPMLVVTAEGKMRELFLDRVNAIAVPEYTLLSSPGRAITHVRIPNTNHTFTSGSAIDKLPSIVGNWATGRFPPIAITPMQPVPASFGRA
jgi:pimeloyl-ACP methyl ester carboxylesterase